MKNKSMQSNMLRFRVHFVFWVLPILLSQGCLPYAPLSWVASPKTEVRVLVPNGYEGPILLAYQIPDGREVQLEDGVITYRLQEDGVLLLQSDPLDGIWLVSFWYEKFDGHLERIPDDTCFEDSDTKGVVVCGGGSYGVYNGLELRPNITYSIAKLENYRTWTDEDYNVLLNQYLNRLALQENSE